MPATPAWPPKSAPRLFVAPPLSAGLQLRLDGNQAHYLGRVMRVAPGTTVILCDDQTGEWAARVTDASRHAIGLEVIEQLRPRENVPDFTLCAALLKKDRFDLVLEKATELGVRTIQPVVTRRCVADRLNHERARTLITEAAEQCARTALPELLPPIKLRPLLEHWPAGRVLFLADEQGGPPAAQVLASHPGPAGLLIGPEGGFDDEERTMVRQMAQSAPFSLGPRILRGETASIAGICLWMAQSGDW